MTYPKSATADVAAEPALPRRSSARCSTFWKADDTFRASIEQPRGRAGVGLLRRPAVRERPAALRAPAHRVREGPVPALPDDARQEGRPRLRLGHPRPARRARGDEAARHHREGARSSAWASPPSTRRRASRCCAYTREWEDYVTRQARWVDFERGYKTLDTDYMESVLWAFKTLYDKGLAYEGYRVLPYCWRDETPLSQPRAAHGRRRLQDAPGPVGDGHVPARRREGRGARPHRACARSRGRRRRGRCRRTSPSPSAPASRTSSSPAARSAPPTCTTTRRPRRRAAEASRTATCSRRSCSPNYAKDLGYETPRMPRAAVERTITRRRAARTCTTTALFDYYADAETWGTAERLAHPRRRLRHHRATAPASSTRRPAYGEDDQRVTEAAGIPTDPEPRRRRAVPARR